MILQELLRYADERLALPPEMYAAAPVHWLVELDEAGVLRGFTPRLDDRSQGLPMEVPTLVRASGIKAKLLADNGEYALGIAREDADLTKVRGRHAAFVALARRCAEETDEPSARAVVRFLEQWNPVGAAAKLPAGFSPAHTLAFRVGDVAPTGLASVQQFWARSAPGAGDGPAMTCLVTGTEGPVEARMPHKVKGVPGGQTAGVALVSANAPAFSHFGLDFAEAASISRGAAERFTKALNHLLATPGSRARVGLVVYAYWTREPISFDPFAIVTDPKEHQVEALFDSPFSGEAARGADAERFYALALSASGGRAVVRDWLDVPLGALVESLRQWFRALDVPDAYGRPAEPLRLKDLGAAVVKPPPRGGPKRPEDEVRPAITSALVRTAFRGARVPDDLLVRAVLRSAAERDVTRARAALFQLYYYTHETLMDDSNPRDQLTGGDRVAHACGGLLAELEGLQRAALGRVNATLTDRYYGAAASTPATAFPALLRGRQAHLAKLRKTSPAAHDAIQKRIEEIIFSYIPHFPHVFSVKQQGLFGLGYYHQRARNRAAAQAAVSAASRPQS